MRSIMPLKILLALILSLVVFPNPVAAFTKIEFTTSQKGKVLFSLFDTNGKLLKSFSDNIVNISYTNHYFLNTAGLSKGKYLLIMKMNERPLKTVSFFK